MQTFKAPEKKGFWKLWEKKKKKIVCVCFFQRKLAPFGPYLQNFQFGKG